MNTFKKLRDKAKATGARPEVQGSWFNIRVIPDLATGELLNIGVGFVGPDNRLHFQLLDRFDALDCLYRYRISSESIRFLVQSVRASLPKELASGMLPLTPSPHILFSPRKMTSGDSIEAILDDLYQETVTLAHVVPAKDDAEDKPDSLDTTKVRKNVFEALHHMDPMLGIVAANPEWPVPVEEGRARVLDMPLRDPRRFGNVLSAWYRTKQNLELNMLRAKVDLDIAHRLYPSRTGGLFILRPPMGQKGYREEHHRQIDGIIDDLHWRMKIHNLRFEVEDSEQRLAEHILDWVA